jgi:signal-transduction protein with cAMP-binding, CBS, and nucleotidyltransferase domain
MNTNVLRVDKQTTVLDATKVMTNKRQFGVVVTDSGKVVGYVTDRRLLTDFIRMNKKPDEVKVADVMAPFYRIEPDANPKEAARKIVQKGITRLGVFEGDKFLGWVTLTDLSRHFSRKSFLDILHSDQSSGAPEFLCPICRSAFMAKVMISEGTIVRWQCPNCGHSL